MTLACLLMMNTSAPRLKIFSATYPLMPLMNVTTAMTDAMPITTPSNVSTERNLFAHNDCRAIRMASIMCMKSVESALSVYQSAAIYHTLNVTVTFPVYRYF